MQSDKNILSISFDKTFAQQIRTIAQTNAERIVRAKIKVVKKNIASNIASCASIGKAKWELKLNRYEDTSPLLVKVALSELGFACVGEDKSMFRLSKFENTSPLLVDAITELAYIQPEFENNYLKFMILWK